jgi:hypothetical protein
LLERRPAKVAAVALAHKLARMAWAIIARGEDWQRFMPSQVLQIDSKIVQYVFCSTCGSILGLAKLVDSIFDWALTLLGRLRRPRRFASVGDGPSSSRDAPSDAHCCHCLALLRLPRLSER